MASTGNVFPTDGASVDRASATAWTNPGNVVSDSGTDATSAVPTDYLVTSGYGFSIPTGALIQGVTVRVEASETGSGNSNYIPQLQSDTTPTLIGAAKTAVTVSGSTKAISSNGGVAALWSATLTPAIVNAAGFGASLWSTDTTNTLAIDFVTIAIEYLPAVTGSMAATDAGASDTAAVAGDVIVQGTLAATDAGASDVAALAGDVIVKGALAVAEAVTADAAALAGVVLVQGDLAATDATDSAELTGTVAVTGDLAVTDADDVLAVSGAVLVQGDLDAADASDVFSATGEVIVAVTPPPTNEIQTGGWPRVAIRPRRERVQGRLRAIEAADTAQLRGFVVPVPNNGRLALVEMGEDVFNAAGIGDLSPVIARRVAVQMLMDL